MDVVIPVFRGLETTLACLDSVLETVPPDTRLWVVNDGSPDSRLMARLRAMASAGRIALIGSGQPDEPARNRGFPAAANAGLRAAGGRDVVLLNSDTLVAPGWLTRLQQAAHSAPDIGTATPISNEASILSVPDPSGGNPAPDLAGTRRLAALAAQRQCRAHRDHTDGTRLLHVHPCRLPRRDRPVTRRPLRPGLRRGE